MAAATTTNHDDELRRRAALREAFGDSSDSDPDAPSPPRRRTAGRVQWIWEAVAGVSGLWLCSAFLSADEQSRLLAAIQREGWFSDAHNQVSLFGLIVFSFQDLSNVLACTWSFHEQMCFTSIMKIEECSVLSAMRFGDLPSWAVELSALIREAICVREIDIGVGPESTMEDGDASPLPSDLLWREPLFDQLIANRYKPGEGICAHVDLMRFDDGIAIVSLESACVMQFSQEQPDDAACDALKRVNGEPTDVPVYLNPGSLVVMSGDARYLWKHEINRRPGAQLWDGRELEQHRRTSVTLRKLGASAS